MSYTLITLWHERRRFIPAVLAVAFSALLMGLQSGLLLGTLAVVSLPIDHSSADLWLATPEAPSLDYGMSIPEHWAARLNSPQIERSEDYIRGSGSWQKPKPSRGIEKCIILGSRLHQDSLGAVRELTPQLRRRLAEPRTVVVDQADLGRLGLTSGIGEEAEVCGLRVHVVGLVHGFKGLGAPHVFCSIETARRLLQLPPSKATFLLARWRNAQNVSAVIERLRRHEDMSVFTSEEFSRLSRLHWLAKTGAGVALGLATALGLLVGAVVTSQTMYAGTVAFVREYAVLRALGIPRWRLATEVLTQACCVGFVGVALALPALLGLAQVAELLGASVLLPIWMLGSTAAVTLAMAWLSGLTALRSLRLAEPAMLLR